MCNIPGSRYITRRDSQHRKNNVERAFCRVACAASPRRAGPPEQVLERVVGVASTIIGGSANTGPDLLVGAGPIFDDAAAPRRQTARHRVSNVSGSAAAHIG